MKTTTTRSVIGGGTGYPLNTVWRMVFAEADNPTTFDETDGSEFFQWINAQFSAATFLPADLPGVFSSMLLRLAWQGDSGDMDFDGFPIPKDWATWVKDTYPLVDVGSSGDYDLWEVPASMMGSGWYDIWINGVSYPGWATDGLRPRLAINSVGGDAYLTTSLWGYVDATGESFAQMSLANPGAWLTKGFEVRWRLKAP